MQELIEKLKSAKDATEAQYDAMIEKYAHNEVLKNLKEAGLSKDDFTQEEFDTMLNEEQKRTNAYAKGAMSASGVLLFLEFLG